MQVPLMIIMLLLNNAGFEKGQKATLERPVDKKEIFAISYQNAGWIAVEADGIHNGIVTRDTIQFLIEEESITLKVGEEKHKASKAEVFEMLSIKETKDGKGYDFITTSMSYNGSDEAKVEKLDNTMRIKGNVITASCKQNSYVETFVIRRQYAQVR
jgi:hypothetical protein